MFQERVRRLLHMIRDLLAELETEVERLALDAITDSLTGVFNRRFFDLRLAEEFERARRYGRHVALVLLDLDDFKEFNDRFGHRRGDQLLLELARVIAGTVREPDVVCRYGGEEFALILPETDERGAVRLLLRLRDRVRQHLPHPISFSAGVAVAPTDGADAMQLLDAADRALYRAKASGKAAIGTASGQLYRMGGARSAPGAEQPPAPPEPPEAAPSGAREVLEALGLALLDVEDEDAGPAAEPGPAGGDAGPPGEASPAADPPPPALEVAPDDAERQDRPLRLEEGGDAPEPPAAPAGSAAAPPGAAPAPTAGDSPLPEPVGVGFSPGDRLPRAVWRGGRVLPVQSAEALPGRSGFRVLTPEGVFTLLRDEAGRWLLLPGTPPPAGRRPGS